MFTRTTRISDALAARPELKTILPAFHPAFAKLNHPVLGRILPKLVTVEDAARIAGVDVDAMLAVMALPGPPAHPAPPAPEDRVSGPPPEWLLHAPEVHDLDARPLLAQGEDPFGAIMTTIRTLPDGHVLCVIAPFEPAPLRRLLGDRGWVSYIAWEEDACRCWFWNSGGPKIAPVDPGERLRQTEAGWVLDVRGLEPPEPLRLALGALERPGVLPLTIRHHREPAILYGKLKEKGLQWTVIQDNDDVRIVIHAA